MDIKLSSTPDLGRPRAIALTALVVMLVAAVPLIFHVWKSFDLALGDTDDATRLVMMRSLLNGGSWYDQLVTRMQPPRGVYMHWSRLIDGGLAAMTWVFRLVLQPGTAENATRMIWPLLWIAPAAASVLMMAQRFGGGAAVFAGAIVMLTFLTLFSQFLPGRVDHHDVQITFCLIALAGAIGGGEGVRGAIASGLATGVGLAIGLEPLAFDGLIGASFAARFLLDPARAPQARAYGLALTGSVLGAFLLQTPPHRWSATACDALALNLLSALVIVGLGLAAAAHFTRAASLPVRLGALVAVGAATLGVYVGLDRNCLKGPFADVDPAIKPIWLNHVQEIIPLSRLIQRKPGESIDVIAPMILGTLAWLWLARRPELRRSWGYWLVGACFFAAVVTAVNAIRMASFAGWFAAPLIAAAAADLSRRYFENAMLATAAGAIFLSPGTDAHGATWVYDQLKPKAKAGSAKGGPDLCFTRSSYAVLARARPVGLAVGDIDLGPFVLAHTPHQTLAAPYHRMSWGILAARSVLAAPAEGLAEQRARALNVAYVLECRTHARNADRDYLGREVLQKRLDAGRPPAWLQPLSPANAGLQVYRVRPRPEAGPGASTKP